MCALRMNSGLTRAILAVLVFLLVASGQRADAHPGHDEKPSGKATAAPAIVDHPGLILPETGGKVPWSDKPVLNDPSRFHFAIMTDNTGGHRPGVWMHAVRNLNMLRPEFVVSVGDLIEGYSTDEALIESQWKEFLGFIDQMEMRFFFVAGNHDVTNPVMHKIWREKFGKEWYSFDYKGVHFVCLCSEDPSSRIGDEQLDWARKDLDANKNARWTFVFMHKPLWTYAESEMAAGNADPTNWKIIEQQLAGRPHNVFAGHTHNYIQFSRNNTKYYQFATTGGASPLRGAKYGEFDHVVWLTMEPDGPHVANILLDGVLPADVVTEEHMAQLRNLLSRTKVQVAPILVRNQKDLSRGELAIRLKNGFESAVDVKARISGFPLSKDGKSPEAVTFTVQPQESTEYRLSFEFPSPIGLSNFAQTTLTAVITSHDKIPTVAEVSVPVIIDEMFTTVPVPAQPVMDGKLGEWQSPTIATRSQPLLLGTTENWRGNDDCSLQFDTAWDDDNLYLYGTVRDDSFFRGRDALLIRLDPRPADVRANNQKVAAGLFDLQCLARPDINEFYVNVDTHGGTRPEGKIVTAFEPVEKGYSFEVAIPLSYLGNRPIPAGYDFQMTLGLLDADELLDSPVYLIWRGTPDILDNNVGMGTFVLER